MGARLTSLLSCVIPVSCLHDQVFLFSREKNFVVTRCGVCRARGVAQAVLIAQFVLNLAVDLFYRLLLGNFEESAARCLRDLLEDFLAIRALLLGISPGPTSAASAHSPHAVSTVSSPVGVLIGKKDGIDQRVGALGRLNRAG